MKCKSPNCFFVSLFAFWGAHSLSVLFTCTQPLTPASHTRLTSLQGVAAVSHATIRGMNPKYYEKVDPVPIEVDSVLHSPVAAAAGEAAFMPSMASHMIPASVLPRRQ